MKVTIKQKSSHNWSNIKSYDKAGTIFSPKLNKLGRVETGLTPEDEDRLEKALRLEKGSLAYNSPYWDTFVVRMREGELTLDTSIPEQEIQYKVLLTMDKFAKSLSEKSAKAEFVIFNEEQEAVVNITARKVKREAFSVFNAMSPTEMRDALTAMGKKADSISNEIAEDMLGTIVETRPEYFLTIAKDKFFKEKVFLNKLIQQGIIKKGGSKVYYDQEMLGHDVESAIEYLTNPKNDNVVEALKKQLKEIKKK